MIVQGWLATSIVLAAGGLQTVIGCLLLRLLIRGSIRRKMMAEVIVAFVLSQGLAATVMSADGALWAKIAFANLAATALVTVWWWARLIFSHRAREPTLVFHCGRFIGVGLRRCRLTEDDVLAALRTQGVAALRATDSVVVGPGGSVSHLRTGNTPRSTLHLVWSRDDAASAEPPGDPHAKGGR